jgi:hypothetical protein
MNRPQSTATVARAADKSPWSLEVVRGRVTGRRYELGLGETVMGNALRGMEGLDLLEHEGDSPRKMADRQAAVVASGHELSIRDLDSPGGTFVNQKRLLSGQSRRLAAGDVIQLGSVQLKVWQTASADATTSAAASKKEVVASANDSAAAGPLEPGRLPMPFVFAAGGQSRNWDDFLVLAAQNWPALRDELSSGRLAEYLRKIGRNDLAPRAGAALSADDQLDQWLARVPSTTSSAPELAVHPESLTIKTKTGGGVIERTLRISNIGYRMLRSSARVAPPAPPWLRIRPEFDGKPLHTIDQFDLPVQLSLPDRIDGPLSAEIVIESNGGTRRVAVRIERPTEPELNFDGSAASRALEPAWSALLTRSIARIRPFSRIGIAVIGAVTLRLLTIVLASVLPSLIVSSVKDPRLMSLAAVLIAAGMAAGWSLARRADSWRDIPAAMVAGGACGLLAAALWSAVLQVIEGLLAFGTGSTWVALLASAAAGALVAGASIWFIPFRATDPRESSP